MGANKTYYDDDGSEKDFWSKPQSQTLYAMKRASPEDSIIFVLRNPKPMKVRKRNAVNATPKSVDASGEEAAAGYAFHKENLFQSESYET